MYELRTYVKWPGRAAMVQSENPSGSQHWNIHTNSKESLNLNFFRAKSGYQQLKIMFKNFKNQAAGLPLIHSLLQQYKTAKYVKLYNNSKNNL